MTIQIFKKYLVIRVRPGSIENLYAFDLLVVCALDKTENIHIAVTIKLNLLTIFQYFFEYAY